MPADGVVSVSGTERGHDTRPDEIEAVARALEQAAQFESFPGTGGAWLAEARTAIAALDAFRAGVPDVSR